MVRQSNMGVRSDRQGVDDHPNKFGRATTTKDPGGSLRIAMFVGRFPEISETFILRQITGLLDLGHEVDVFAEMRSEGVMHREVQEYGLLDRVTFIDLPPASAPWEISVWPITGKTWLPGAELPLLNWRRILQAALAFCRCAAKAPGLTCEVVSPTAYGYQAASLSALFRLAHLCAVTKAYDIVHAHFGPVGNNFRFVRALWPVPFVVTFHGYDFCAVPHKEGPAVYHGMFRATDAVTVNCEYARQRVAKLGCPAERIHKLHVGIDIEQFAFRERARRRGEPVRIITVARLVPKKGLEYAIRAVATARQSHPEVQYEIIGGGPLQESLVKLVADLNLKESVVLHGVRDSEFIRERMAAAHIFLLPSVTAENDDQEGTPVSLMEAQASGIPVVSTQHSGIPEVVLDGESGFLLSERDVEGLAAKLRLLIDRPDICRRMGQRGRSHMQQHFNLRTLNRELVCLYETLRNSASNGGGNPPTPSL